MARDHTFSRSEIAMEVRIKNWGVAMRGGYPGGLPPDEETRDPNLLDADIIELAMCELKQKRELLYEIAEYLYVRGRSDQEAANVYRRPESWIHDRNREAIRWVINYLRRTAKEVA